MKNQDLLHKAKLVAPFVGLLVLCWLVYQPGLTGTFLFDDWKNLELIGQLGTIDTFHDLVTYLLSGFASPLGRPVAMASFLIDARDWPADPATFKATNVAIHLINGVLLFAVSRLLLRFRGLERIRATQAAVLAAGLWLLHPLWVSTVLYPVQRMAMLAAAFVLLALYCYLKGRVALEKKRETSAGMWLWLGMGTAGMLGVMSKENAALLPFFVVILDHTVLHAHPWQENVRWAKWWRWLYVRLPIVLLLLYLGSYLPALFQGEQTRGGYTVMERLLTEGRVMMEYLWRLLVPKPYTTGLFNDNIDISRTMFQPASTAWSWLALLFLASIGYRLRQDAPLASLGIGFFWVGHLLESSIIPLEVSFEHRNYLPAAFLFLYPSRKLVAAANWRMAKVAVIGIVAVYAAVTLQRASLWGTPFLQAFTWSQEAPGSARAQVLLSSRWLETGNLDAAKKILTRAVAAHPRNPAVVVSLLKLECRGAGVATALRKKINDLFSEPPSTDPVTRYQLEQALRAGMDGNCKGVDRKAVLKWIDSGLQSPAAGDRSWRRMLLVQRGRLALQEGDVGKAYNDFSKVVSLDADEEGILNLAARLASHGGESEALRLLDNERFGKEKIHLNSLRNIRRLWLRWNGYYENERKVLRKIIFKELRKKGFSIGKGEGDQLEQQKGG